MSVSQRKSMSHLAVAEPAESPRWLGAIGADLEPTLMPTDYSHEADADMAGSTGLVRRRNVTVFAHRGASGLFAEHSRAAYMRAIEEGADGLELDLHLSQDGEVVCIHDETLERTTDGAGAVRAASLQYLRSLDITSWKNPDLPRHYGHQREQFMSLRDVLELALDAPRSLRLALEFKRDKEGDNRLQDRTVQVLLSYGWDPEHSVIRGETTTVEISFMGFAAASLTYFKNLVAPSQLCALFEPQNASEIAQSLSTMKLPSTLRPLASMIASRYTAESENLVWTGRAGIAGPGMRYVKMRQDIIKAWVARGVTLRVWTVDEIADANLLEQLGVHEMTTNYPARILATSTVEGQSQQAAAPAVSSRRFVEAR